MVVSLVRPREHYGQTLCCAPFRMVWGGTAARLADFLVTDCAALDLMATGLRELLPFWFDFAIAGATALSARAPTRVNIVSLLFMMFLFLSCDLSALSTWLAA